MSYKLHKLVAPVITAGLIMMVCCASLAAYSGLLPSPQVRHIEVSFDEVMTSPTFPTTSCGFPPE
ncbi:hypothetical protein [Bacterioplanoides sp. SCSIO 12839]|uniref:hypothetical protein n=1 Tax=Bacterioplanoides sp. SCSIO 12839 TaxID=2829569 RepID=UPI0021062039|nr:hypothetical protein [Bacterioplanoides sp. SCSIO 12839]UTW49329.1 hypothetical protein KFF03_05340 [Bacterioplanoides sp. SCSIO 12839]